MNALSGKLVVGVLYAEREHWERAAEELKRRFGPFDGNEITFPFDGTDYYQNEMGSGLTRLICSFTEPVAADELAEIKLWTNRLEEKMADTSGGTSRRRVNLDPGILTLFNLVLATTKGFCHRIYLKEGIYAELALCYRGGVFEPLEWTYPDYRKPETLAFFKKMKEEWRRMLRRMEREEG